MGAAALTACSRDPGGDGRGETVLQALDRLLPEQLGSRWFALRARHLSSALTKMAKVSMRRRIAPLPLASMCFLLPWLL